MDEIKLLEKYFKKDSKAFKIILNHSKQVTKKALELASRVPELKPDLVFIKEAAMLHDIGISQVDAKGLHCYGKENYLLHGVLGRQLLEKEGFPKHGLVCERHFSTGITVQEIVESRLPLPAWDMLPLTIEEEIICYADQFFSKGEKNLGKEKDFQKVRQSYEKFGPSFVERFDIMARKFGDLKE